MAIKGLRGSVPVCAGGHQSPAAGDLRQLAGSARQRAGGQLPGDRAEPLQRAWQGLPVRELGGGHPACAQAPGAVSSIPWHCDRLVSPDLSIILSGCFTFVQPILCVEGGTNVR